MSMTANKTKSYHYFIFTGGNNMNLKPIGDRIVIKKAREKAVKYTDDILLKYLKQLAELDLKIKKGLIDKDLALELFILEM